jgi:lysophospholipase L1-like esterase
MTLIFKVKQTIEFIGDSITDCGRREPLFSPLGDGYVRIIHDLLQAGYPELKLRVVNKGISGDTVLDLKGRWNTEVLDINPNWLFIYIGINDVWRFYDGDRDKAVALPAFTSAYKVIIDKTLNDTTSAIRLVSPFLAESDANDPFRRKLGVYQEEIDKIGEEFEIPVVHLQPAIDWAMLSKPGDYWTNDRVHPTREGHMLIALTILRACGFRL